MSLAQDLRALNLSDPFQLATVGPDHWYSGGFDWVYHMDRVMDPCYLEHQIPHQSDAPPSRVRLFPDGIGGYIVLAFDALAPLQQAVTSRMAPHLSAALAIAAEAAGRLHTANPALPEAA